MGMPENSLLFLLQFFIVHGFELSLHTHALKLVSTPSWVLASWNCSCPAKIALLHTTSPHCQDFEDYGEHKCAVETQIGVIDSSCTSSG